MKNKILLFVLLCFLTLGICACTGTGTGTQDPDETPGSGTEQPGDGEIVVPEKFDTPYTDALKLDAYYSNKSFIEDGIGVVTLGNVTDGDTAIFKENGKSFTVRFNGVNTPESTYKLEPWGIKASNFVKGILNNAYKIVLQTDTLKTNRLDSTGKRYLAWVWYQADANSDFRLLNLEIIENCLSASKASGMMYADELLDADLLAQKLDVYIWNRDHIDPDYDYSDSGEYLTLKELRDTYDGTTDSHKKVIVRGVVARKIGKYSAYIQQQEDGVWHIGDVSLEVTACEENPEMPYVGENGNWFIGEVDTNQVAENGKPGQSLYNYYLENSNDAELLPEAEWYETLVKGEIDDSINYPYILQDGEYYGVYLYGGFSGIASRLTIGYEVKVVGNIGTYYGALQITGVTSDGIKVLSPLVDGVYQKVEPHIYEVSDITELTIDNVQMLGTLVELSNLTVYGGYNTASSDAYTIKCKDVNGNKINIRVDGNSAIHQDKEGEFIEVAAQTDTTGKKGYYTDGAINPDGYHVINCWQYFEGKTFEKVRGIVTVYDGEYGEAEIQIMLTLESDIELR